MNFVSFEIAQKLKEKGYPIKRKRSGILGLTKLEYIDELPTISQVLKWLREKKKIFVAINIGYCYESYEKPFPTNPKMEPILKGYYYGIWELDNLNDKNACSEYFEAPEFAILAGIEYVIDNLI